MVVFLILWLVQARSETPDTDTDDGPLTGSITPTGDVSLRLIKADSDEAKWKTAALTFLAWLYRRDEWNGLSGEARNAEELLRTTHANGSRTSAASTSTTRCARTWADPWWEPPKHSIVAIGGTRITCSCGWQDEGHLFNKHAGLPEPAPTWRPRDSPAVAPPPGRVIDHVAPEENIRRAGQAEATGRAAVAGRRPNGRPPFLKEMGHRYGTLTTQGQMIHDRMWAMPLAQAHSDAERNRHERACKRWLAEISEYAGTYWLITDVIQQADDAAATPSTEAARTPMAHRGESATGIRTGLACRASTAQGRLSVSPSSGSVGATHGAQRLRQNAPEADARFRRRRSGLSLSRRSIQD